MNNLGIDIGGSYLKYVINSENKIKKNKKSIKQIIANSEIDKLIKIIKHLVVKNNIQKLGLAVAGLYNKSEGVISHSPNLPMIENIKFKNLLIDKLKINVSIENDASLAALGEYKHGNGKNSKILLTLTLGTGLGGGLIINGQIFSGVKGTALEPGHTTIDYNGWPCSCGRKGCLESYASSYGLERIYFLKTKNKTNSNEIINLALKKNQDAKNSLIDFSHYLSIGIVNLIHLFNPDKIILAGGIITHYPLLINEIKKRINQLAFTTTTHDLIIQNSLLGEYSGAFGALELALKN